jgi:hypothetical protein
MKQWNVGNKRVASAVDEDEEQDLRPWNGQFCSMSFRNDRHGPFVSIPLFVDVLSTMTKQ